MTKLQFKESELVSFIEDMVNEETLEHHKPILSESKERRIGIWADRFERKSRGKSPELVFESFSQEIHKLKRNGISTSDLSDYLQKNERVINEQAAFSMSQNQGVGGTVWETVREGLYGWILKFFGLSGEFGKFLSQSLANIPFSEIPKLMNCNYLVPFLTKGIIEYAVGKFATTKLMGQGSFEMLFRNSLTNLGDNSQFYQDLEKKVRDTVCGALGKKKEQVQDSLKDVEEDSKEKFKGQDLSGGGTVPPETSGQQNVASDLGDGLSGMANKYFQQFMQNLSK
jgi:hypothetical protein